MAELWKQAFRELSSPSPALVTLFVLGFYISFTTIALSLHQWNPLWFVWIGERYANLDPAGRTGYDGQFVYYIARYGSAAVPHLDCAPYRLQRILFPVTVYLLSHGSPELVPWVMIGENIAAIVLTTYLLARWLGGQGLSPVYALMYSLYVGTFMAYSRALTEPLALCLVTVGIVLWLNRLYAPAIIALAFALLAKETTLLFVAGIVASTLAQGRARLAVLALISMLPWAVWQAYLLIKLGSLPVMAGPSLEPVPLRGIIPYLTLEPGRISSFFFVGLPGLIAFCFAIPCLIRDKGRSPAVWWLALHSIFVVLMPAEVYDHIMHAGRNAGGLALSAIFLLPALKSVFRLSLLCCSVLPTLVWLVPVLRWAPWWSRI